MIEGDAHRQRGFFIMNTHPFEQHIERYEEWFAKHPLVYQAELRAVKWLAPQHAAGVEIGVGTGRFAEPLGITIGLEPAKAMGAEARKKGIVVVDGVAEALPFKAEQFDFALMVTTLCFKEGFGEGAFVVIQGMK